MASDPAVPLVEATHPPESPEGGGEVVTLCGGYQLDENRTHPLLADMPAVLHLPARLGQHRDLANAFKREYGIAPGQFRRKAAKV